MAIDLNGINPSKLNPQKGRAEREQNVTDARERRADGAQDDVQISREAQNVERLAAQVRDAESFDQQRVQEITQAIREGRYPVDSQRVAEKFLELESQLY